MILKADLLKLIRSTSSAEQTYFRARFRTKTKEPEYLKLFNFILKHTPTNVSELENLYKQHYPSSSLDNHAHYLFHTLTDCLVQMRIDQDQSFDKWFTLLRAQLFTERSMTERSLLALQNANRYSMHRSDPFFDFFRLRQELLLLHTLGYPHMEENDLVDLQMKAQNRLRMARQLHEHYSLFEMLSYRLSRAASTPLLADSLADLVLHEISIVSRGHTPSFEQQKLHLLFQSFYFMQTNDYGLALKVFKQLNHLFEQHEDHWNFPPYDYLTALEGVLDNLYTISYASDMTYFLNKVAQLTEANHPEHFTLKAQQVHLIYSMKQHLNTGELEQAKALLSQTRTNGRISHFLDTEKQAEWFFLTGILYFKSHDTRKARQYILEAIPFIDNRPTDMLSRAIRLLNLILTYRAHDLSYISHEIRNYKRMHKQKGSMLQSEKLLLYVLNLDPKMLSRPRKRAVLTKCSPTIALIKKSKQEMNLLKHYDFCQWITEALTSSS